MIRHYFHSAWVKALKTPFTTAANILTLALGIACFIAAYGVASWWGAADHYHRDAGRIFVVGQTNRIAQAAPERSQQAGPRHAISSWAMAQYLRSDFPELEHVARVVRQSDVAVAGDADKAILNVAVADPDFLDIFDFTFVEGDAATALGRPGSAVLTAEAAIRLFGGKPALGRPVLVNGAEEATVTGVISPVRQPSFMGAGQDAALRFDMIRDWAGTPLGRQLDGLSSWIGLNPYTFVVLPPSMTVEAFNARLPEFLERRVPASDREVAQISLHAFPAGRLSTFSLDGALLAGGAAGLTAVAALLGLAALTLFIACVNYANLATAQAAARAREIGLRRTLGAARAQVMLQAWTEAALLTIGAMLLALLILLPIVPVVRTQTGIELLHFLSRGAAPLGFLALLAATVTLVAGAYPALVLSRVRPITVLRSASAQGGPKRLARVLVGVQFASAGFLLILVVVTQLQRLHLQRTALAPHEDPIVVLNDLMPLDVTYETLAARLAAQSDVRNVSVVDHMPWGTSYNGVRLASSADPAATAHPAFAKSVGYDYFATLDLDVLAGRVFDRVRDTTPSSLFAFANSADRPVPAVIDRRYARALGFETPQAAVGKLVYMPAAFGAAAAQPVEIIGVTETEWTRLDADAGAGHVYTYAPRALWGQQLPILSLARGDVAGTLSRIEAVWEELAPAIPLDVRFFDTLFEHNFRTYARVSQIFMLLAASAFVIASVGLVGIAVHAAARRRREIGVRKTLGASTGRVLRMLIVDFSGPVVIGSLAAWPFAWAAAHTYLQNFAERTALTPLPFLFSLAVTLVIAWLAVGGQAWRAASLKPALVLRAE